jgi:hypothetical protein
MVAVRHVHGASWGPRRLTPVDSVRGQRLGLLGGRHACAEVQAQPPR